MYRTPVLKFAGRASELIQHATSGGGDGGSGGLSKGVVQAAIE